MKAFSWILIGFILISTFFLSGCSSDGDVIILNKGNGTADGILNANIITNNIIINGTLDDSCVGSSARTVATAFTATVLRCNAFPIGQRYTTDGVGFIVATANASTNFKIAFYNSTKNGYPDRLQFNTTNTSFSGTGVILNSSFGTFKFQANTLYWACYSVDIAGTERVNMIPLADINDMGITSSTAPNTGYTVAYTYTDALPDPYTAGATFITTIVPAVYTRIRTDI